ncbi:MAG: [protein-PII] uridylyltransferase [Planctomycetes bacterium]|nr:[protein-PII] uridylyltransferase [Planctomycetota bacterium]
MPAETSRGAPFDARAEIAAAREVLRRKNREGDPLEAARGFSAAIDGMVRGLFRATLGEADPHGVALLALGGYGRAELAPFSDVDVLLLIDPRADVAPIETFVRALWDMGLEPSTAVRSIDETSGAMACDDRTATTILESRRIAGDAALDRDLRERAIPAFLREHGGAYAAIKRGRLADSMRACERMPFRGEPRLKEGPAGLRDVQRILWIERARGRAGTLDDLAGSGLPPDRVEALRAAYTFLVRVRCELQLVVGLRQDTLEFPAQGAIAGALGFAPVEGRPAEEILVEACVRHAREIHRAGRLYLEILEDAGMPAEASAGAARILPAGVILAGGAVRVRKPRPAPAPFDPAEILEPFLVAQEHGVGLTPGACEEIRLRAADLPDSLADDPEAARTFLEMARRPGFGRVATALAETGILERIIPAFRAIAGRIELDGYHECPADEHTLAALRELDRLASRADHEEPSIRAALLEIRRPEILRLAVLFHDIGKARPGPHAARGGEIAERACERLGLDRRGIAGVRFLVHHHLEMNHTAQRRDFHERPAIEAFAGLVEDVERLRALYVLTYVDIRSVAGRAWTPWKGVELARLYDETRTFLAAGRLPDPTRWFEEELARRDTPEDERARLRRHVASLGGARYAREHRIETIVRHADLCGRIGTVAAAVEFEAAPGAAEVAVATRDRPGLFADLVGLLSARGLTILSARVHSRDDGVALDIFHVAPGDGLRIPIEDRLYGFREDLTGLEAGATTVQRRLAEARRRIRTPPRPALRRPPAIRFDADPSAEATVIEIVAADRLGLLHDLASALSAEGLDIRTARVATLATLAVDTFYVLDREGRPIVKPRDRARIEEALRTALG